MLACLILPVVSTLGWLNYKKFKVRKKVKREIIAGISRDKLVLLGFLSSETKTKLRWEHSKEFEFDNQMYDIVETNQVKDSVYYWCWLDNDETQLNKHLKTVAEKTFNTNPQKKEKQNQLIVFFKGLYCEKFTSPNLSLYSNSHDYFRRKGASLYFIYKRPPVPPPKFV